jgi:Protein of unknown function (DUF3365)
MQRSFPEADMSLLRTALVAAGLMTTTVGAQIEFKSWPLSQAPAELRFPISRADLVVVAMQDAMLRELHDALARGGPAGAINFCHLEATAITQRVGREEGIAAGRTSDRLRNPTNAPRPWAAPFVNAYAGRPARSIEGFAVDLGDKVGVLRPMVERPMCGGCHGSEDRVAPGVKLVLRDRYPADRAVGFTDGEIRGWFWVEIPKRLR